MIFCLLRLYTMLHDYFAAVSNKFKVESTYLLTEDGIDDYDEEFTRVPEGCIYVQEWHRDGETRRRLLYDGEEVTPYTKNPFRPIKQPWLWIGDTTTGVDLTDAVGRYLMADNVIMLDLILRMLNVNRDTKICYMDVRTLEAVPFPSKGVRIDENGE